MPTKKATSRVVDMTGKKVGRLTVIEYAGVNRGGKAKWLCTCECGGSVTTTGRNLRRGSAKSCGCLRRDLTSARFSGPAGGGYLIGARAFAARTGRLLDLSSYTAMINRCTNPSIRDFKYYGAVGRTVDTRWLHGVDGKTGFHCFVEDMPPRPSREMTLDRIDNSLGYSPGNCRWATKAQQTANRG